MALPRKQTNKVERYLKMLKNFDYFEHRYDYSSQTTYLFNPFTGESCSEDENGFVNRLYSYWSPREENNPSTLTDPIMLFPETYASRQWGRRRFRGFDDDIDAATHIASVARGFLVRQRLRKYYSKRYVKTLDEDSGYYFFTDTEDESEEPVTTWYKPRLAFPSDIDIRKKKIDDPEKFMGQKKYTYASFVNGPYFRRKLRSGGACERTEMTHFVYQNPKKVDVVYADGDWDLDDRGLGEWIHMLDGWKAKDVLIDDYLVISNARTGNNVKYVLELMQEYNDRPLIQAYGLHAISNMEHSLDVAGCLSYHDRKAFEYCFKFIQINGEKFCSNTETIFALRAMYSYLYLPAGRAEFFDAASDNAKEGDDFYEGVKGRLILKRIKQFCKSIETCPVDTKEFRIKEGRKHKIVKFSTPTVRGVEIALYSAKCIACLACRQDQREPIGEYCIRSALFALDLFLDEPDVLCAALQCIYNFVYRCEVGHQLVNSFPVHQAIEKVEAAFPGDAEVLRQCTRVRLSLEFDGWRGNVENHLDYDENGRAVYTSSKLRPARSVSSPAPSADQGDTERECQVGEVVQVPGGLNDVSMLSAEGAEDQLRSPQRRHK